MLRYINLPMWNGLCVSLRDQNESERKKSHIEIAVGGTEKFGICHVFVLFSMTINFENRQIELIYAPNWRKLKQRRRINDKIQTKGNRQMTRFMQSADRSVLVTNWIERSSRFCVALVFFFLFLVCFLFEKVFLYKFNGCCAQIF